MEKTEVLIKIVDSHKIDGESEGTEITTLGTFEGDENNYTLRYSESGEFDGCDISLNVEDKNKITMTRTGSGSFHTQLIMEKGRRHNCCYSTPAGEMMIGVFANMVSSDVKADGGNLRFRYTLDFNAGLVSENELEITVKSV